MSLILFSDEFANLDSSLSLDWSTSIDSVVYTVQVTRLTENVYSMDVLLQIDPPSSKFKLNEANNCKFVLISIIFLSTNVIFSRCRVFCFLFNYTKKYRQSNNKTRQIKQ